MLPALPLLWNVIFFLAQKNSACVVSEEYLDTAFSYLREVLVSVQRNHQSKMFTTNDFVNFLGRFLCYLICPAGYRMTRAPLELNWLQSAFSAFLLLLLLTPGVNFFAGLHLEFNGFNSALSHAPSLIECKIISAGSAGTESVNGWGVQRAFLNSTPSYSFVRTKQKGKVQNELCCVNGFFSNKQKCCWVFHLPWKFARKQRSWGKEELLKMMYPKLFLCYLYKAFASVTAC